MSLVIVFEEEVLTVVYAYAPQSEKLMDESGISYEDP